LVVILDFVVAEAILRLLILHFLGRNDLVS
jgi:hypothetical protein